MKLSSATKALHGMVREKVPYFDFDDPMTDHAEAVAEMFESGAFLEALPKNTEAYDW